MYKLSLFCCR